MAWSRILCAVAVMALALPAAASDQVQRELDEMRDLVRSLSDQLEAQQRQIDERQQVLETAELQRQSDALSGLASFLEATDFYGHVSATYMNDLTFAGGNDGALAGSINAPFSGVKPNTFSLNQLWFGMDKTPTAESRAGYHVDIAYGLSAPFAGGSSDTLEVYSAYVSYLMPIGNGVQMDAGELWTPLGAEVVDTTGNFNITRGAVWWLQPKNHVGVMLSTMLNDSFGLVLGAVNDPFSDANVDTDNNKALMGQLGFYGENYAFKAGAIWGSQAFAAGSSDDKYGLVDVLLTMDPSDQLSLWINYNYNWFKNTPMAFGYVDAIPPDGDSEAHAVAAAARLALTEKTGVALRGEYIAFDLDGGSEPNLITVTGTVDHQLTNNLLGRVEVRYNNNSQKFIVSPGTPFTTRGDGDANDEEVIVATELVYSF